MAYSELFLNYVHKGLVSAGVISPLLMALAMQIHTPGMGGKGAPPWVPRHVGTSLLHSLGRKGTGHLI